MAAQRYGGRYSPADKSGTAAEAPPPPAPFRDGRARKVSLRARLLFLLPLPLLFAGLGATFRGSAPEMIGELGGFAGLMLSAWLLNEGLRAEEAYAARAVARPPAIPRKLFAAVLTGVSIFGAGLLGLDQGLAGAIAFGLVAAGAQLLAFGLDPMRRKGLEGVDEFATERIARAIDEAEALVKQTEDAAARIGDRRLEGRIDRLADQARQVFRVVEQDPRDLARARTFLSVYLLGLRDATVEVRRHLGPEPRPGGAEGLRGAARRPRAELHHPPGEALDRRPQRARHRDRGAARAVAAGRADRPPDDRELTR